MARISLTHGHWALAAGVGALTLTAGLIYYAAAPRGVPPAPDGTVAIQDLPPETTEAAPAPGTADSGAAAPDEVAAPPAGADGPDGDGSDAAEDAPSATAEVAPPAEEAAPPDLPLPTFDLVRAEASGQVLVAGRGAGGHEIRLFVDDALETTGAVESGGGFVLFLDVAPSDAPRVLDLVSVGPDGTERRSEESVILAPPPRPTEVAVSDPVAEEAPDPLDERAPTPLAGATPEEAPRIPEVSAEAPAAAPVLEADAQSEAPSAAVAPTGTEPGVPAADLAGEVAPELPAAAESAEAADASAAALPARETDATEDVARAEAGAVAAPVAPDAPAPGVAAAQDVDARPAEGVPSAGAAAPARAPSVLVARDDGVSLLQPSSGADRLDRVVIDVISYDEEGTVTLKGRSAAPPPPIDSVRVYLNNAPIQTARIGADGSWRLPLRGVESGVYTLRVDQIDASGNVVSRFETPFKREDPVNLARLEAQQPAPDESLAVSVITVQPGYTLWGIASDRYGDGFRYVAIFDANDHQIRDPDLIYPGQVFDLPDLDAAD
ncbi:MAG: LysM peptidoglycan-binding domain-containing protein [Pseudomonadota bacterium]